MKKLLKGTLSLNMTKLGHEPEGSVRIILGTKVYSDFWEVILPLELENR